MASLNMIIVILVLVFCAGVPLFVLTTFMICHYCDQQSDQDNIPRRRTYFGQDSDEENNQSHVRESVHLSTVYTNHRVWSPTPSIWIQDDSLEVHTIPTIVVAAAASELDQPTIKSLPRGPIGGKVIKENPGVECSICLAEYCVDDVVRRLPCAHSFHVHCIDRWLKDNAVCPLCKTDLNHLLSPY